MYTVDYFIEKFEAISEDKWTILTTGRAIDSSGVVVSYDGDKKVMVDAMEMCAIGHCGGYKASESVALAVLFSKYFRTLGILSDMAPLDDLTVVFIINDTYPVQKLYPFIEKPPINGATPKERILSVLYEIRDVDKAVREAEKITQEQLQLA